MRWVLEYGAFDHGSNKLNELDGNLRHDTWLNSTAHMDQDGGRGRELTNFTRDWLFEMKRFARILVFSTACDEKQSLFPISDGAVMDRVTDARRQLLQHVSKS